MYDGSVKQHSNLEGPILPVPVTSPEFVVFYDIISCIHTRGRARCFYDIVNATKILMCDRSLCLCGLRLADRWRQTKFHCENYARARATVGQIKKTETIAIRQQRYHSVAPVVVRLWRHGDQASSYCRSVPPLLVDRFLFDTILAIETNSAELAGSGTVWLTIIVYNVYAYYMTRSKRAARISSPYARGRTHTYTHRCACVHVIILHCVSYPQRADERRYGRKFRYGTVVVCESMFKLWNVSSATAAARSFQKRINCTRRAERAV